jgi:hypothetical protein
MKLDACIRTTREWLHQLAESITHQNPGDWTLLFNYGIYDIAIPIGHGVSDD